MWTQLDAKCSAADEKEWLIICYLKYLVKNTIVVPFDIKCRLLSVMFYISFEKLGPNKLD